VKNRLTEYRKKSILTPGIEHKFYSWGFLLGSAKWKRGVWQRNRRELFLAGVEIQWGWRSGEGRFGRRMFTWKRGGVLETDSLSGLG